MEPTSYLPSDGSGALCSVCRNLEALCPLPVELNMFVAGEGKGTNVSFSRPIWVFDKSADQGCPICWIIASVGRSYDDSIDPMTRISLWLDAYGNSRLLCNGSLHDIYIPEEKLSCQSRYTSSHFLVVTSSC